MPRDTLRSEDRSNVRIVYFALDVNEWLARGVPSVEAARPACCPGCGAASRPVGRGLVLHGHGVRDRDVGGPPSPDARPVLRVVTCRRYRCLACAAVCLVVPRGVLPRRCYLAAAIALALALWGTERLTATAVRERVGLGTFFEEGWRSLRRWTRAVVEGRLFAGFGGGTGPLRAVAERVAAWLAGRAPPGTPGAPLPELAFAGAGLAP